MRTGQGTREELGKGGKVPHGCLPLTPLKLTAAVGGDLENSGVSFSGGGGGPGGSGLLLSLALLWGHYLLLVPTVLSSQNLPSCTWKAVSPSTPGTLMTAES